jgi:integrase
MGDTGGLYLEVAPSGGKWWRLKYRFGSKEKRLSLGVYPDVSLKDARERRDEARKFLAKGIDPALQRKAVKDSKTTAAANTLEVVARQWFLEKSPEWAESNRGRIIRRLERDIFPWIGDKPISEINTPLLLEVLKRISDRGLTETAHKARQSCRQIFVYAIQKGLAMTNPVDATEGALPSVKNKNFAAITDPIKVGEFMRAVDAFKGTLTVQCALRLAPLVFVRPGELRKAQWDDIDLDRAIWAYHVSKTDAAHIVSLSHQAVAILKEIQPLTGHGQYVFPGARKHTRPMSDAAINAALRRMGYDTQNEITGHGFRAMARTILHERLKFDPAIIEHQLAHRVADTLGTAYNRTKFLDDRIQMMQAWADYLDELKAGAKVIPLHGNAV